MQPSREEDKGFCSRYIDLVQNLGYRSELLGDIGWWVMNPDFQFNPLKNRGNTAHI